MRKRTLGLYWVAMALMLSSLVAVAANPEITYQMVDRESYRDIEVTTPFVSYVFSEDGGVMKSAYLTFVPYGSTAAELVSGTNTVEKTLVRQYNAQAEYPFSIPGYEHTVYESDVTVGADGELVLEFSADLGDAVVVKRFTVWPDTYYNVEVDVSVNNTSDTALPIQMTLGKRTPSDGAAELHYLYDGEPSTSLLAEGSYFNFGGIGVLDKQIVLFLSTDEGGKVDPFVVRTEDGDQRYGVKFEAGAGRTDVTYSLYGGRRRYILLEEAGLAALDEPGVGSRMIIPVVRFLTMLYNATGNYGWAIILLTLIVRVVLYPLMRKQYHSMAKMQKIQPKLKIIQERFKDDKQLLQQKMMQLYKDEGVNPMGGCLPMFIQLPIIYVIWRAVLYTAEQIHLSPGFLWMPDLSLPDPYFILVILTTAIMLVQQWLMTPTAAAGSDAPASTKYMGYIFPIFMAVLLWRFPAGLWLYYLLTTGTQVIQQAYVNREIKRADGPGLRNAIDVKAEPEDDGDAEA